LPDVLRPAASPFYRAAAVAGCIHSVIPGNEVLHDTYGVALIFFSLSEARSSSDSGLIVAEPVEQTMRYRFRNIDGFDGEVNGYLLVTACSRNGVRVLDEKQKTEGYEWIFCRKKIYGCTRLYFLAR